MTKRSAGRWLDGADPLTQVLWRQGGVITRTQALAHMSAKALEHKVRSGRWQRVHDGIYVSHGGPVTRDHARWIGYLSAGRHAYLAGATAAELCGLRGFPSRAVQVLIPARHRPRNPPSGVVVHRTTRLTRFEVNPLGLPPHTTAARALVDAAAWAATDDIARSLVAAGYQQRLVGAGEVDAVVARLGRVPRRALIIEAARDARDGAHSLPEARFRHELRRARLPLPHLQVRRRDGEGGVRYLDAYYEEWRLHVEIDGAQHVDVRAYWADMRRQNAVWITGDRILRFPAWAVRHQPGEVVAQVRAALVAAGWRPRPHRPDLGRLHPLQGVQTSKIQE
jgi:very-short-patch-repair endonuclease